MSHMDRHHTLPGGGRIRVRIPRISDRAGLRSFLERQGADDLDVRRHLRWAPRAGCWTVVATQWDGGRDRVVGLATIDEDFDGAPTLLADDAAVYQVLAQALADRAETARRR